VAKLRKLHTQFLQATEKISRERIMVGSLKELGTMIKKGFEEHDKVSIEIIDKSNKMLIDTRDSVEICDPRSVSKIFDTGMYIKKHADNMLKEYFEFSSKLSILKKKFEDDCICKKR
jgi:hypothetical protein